MTVAPAAGRETKNRRFNLFGDGLDQPALAISTAAGTFIFPPL